jgi:bifunctional DNase/RNase
VVRSVFSGKGVTGMLIKVDIVSFAVDPVQNLPIIILKESNGERTLPILIGSSEASAIAIKTLNIASDRPLTIDLARAIMEELGGTLKRVVINDLIDNVFYARLYVAAGKSMHIIDCRSSDAIAFALRCECTIFVEDCVFEKNDETHYLTDKEKLRKDIADRDTLDFGRYYLE